MLLKLASLTKKKCAQRILNYPTKTEEYLYSWLTMFWCERGIDTCDPPGRICCCPGPCTPRAQTRSRWPRGTRCCGRNLPGPPRLRGTQPARSLSLKDSKMPWLLLQKRVKKTWVHCFYEGKQSKELLEVRSEEKEIVQRILQFIEFKSSPLLQPFIRPICCVHINSGA